MYGPGRVGVWLVLRSAAWQHEVQPGALLRGAGRMAANVCSMDSEAHGMDERHCWGT